MVGSWAERNQRAVLQRRIGAALLEVAGDGAQDRRAVDQPGQIGRELFKPLNHAIPRVVEDASAIPEGLRARPATEARSRAAHVNLKPRVSALSRCTQLTAAPVPFTK